MARRLFTSESVTEGYPDKMADQISDAILDAMIKDDPGSHVAVETLITTGQVHVAGEVTTETYVDIPTIIREKILEIGYDSSAKGYDGASCGVSVSIGAQSPDIAQGVLDAFEYREGEGASEFDRQGAGDQGLMFGYACRETPELMPLPIMLAHRLARRLSQVRRSGDVPYLRPDGKTQVTIEYSGDEPVRLDTVVISAQHAPDIDLKELLAPDVRDHVVAPVVAGLDLDTAGYRLLVNPTGRFEIGGPMGDAGLTGRKIIIDTYGGMARHGGDRQGPGPAAADLHADRGLRTLRPGGARFLLGTDRPRGGTEARGRTLSRRDAPAGRRSTPPARFRPDSADRRVTRAGGPPGRPGRRPGLVGPGAWQEILGRRDPARAPSPRAGVAGPGLAGRGLAGRRGGGRAPPSRQRPTCRSPGCSWMCRWRTSTGPSTT